ncbi:MAG TPA: T9SS type A sorting domain-containing protein [Bacteroidetes bacterium]|nr:T9SS type A sorting domain-containing protein [Bacteroidota bacterium]
MKTSLFFIGFILFTFCGKAQTEFAPIGATWHFEYYEFVSTVGYEKIVAAKDTMILGRQAKKLELTRATTYYGANGVINTEREDHYIYQTGDTVYHYTNDSFMAMDDFVILYDFSLVPGDTLFYGSGFHYFVLDSIGTVELNGEEYRSQYGRIPDSEIADGITIINEKFGAMNDYLFLDIQDYCFLDGDCQYFRCYEDSNFPLLQLSQDSCEHIPTFVATNEQAPPPALFISPNPAQGFVQVKFPAPAQASLIHLFSTDGKRIKTLEIQAGTTQKEIALGGLPAGLYYIQWQQNGIPAGCGKIMVQK